METDPSPAFTRLQRHNVKKNTIPNEEYQQLWKERKFKRYHNTGRGARFGRGGGTERGRARFRYPEQKNPSIQTN